MKIRFRNLTFNTKLPTSKAAILAELRADMAVQYHRRQQSGKLARVPRRLRPKRK